MGLTSQMQRELQFMDGRITAIFNEAFSNIAANFGRCLIAYREEANAYKVKLEILFSDTDIKEQSSNHFGKFIIGVNLKIMKNRKFRCIDISFQGRKKDDIDGSIICREICINEYDEIS